VPVLQAPRETPPPAPAPKGGEINRIMRLEVPVIVRLAERRLPVSEVMRLGTGAIIEFFKRHDEPLELLVNNKPIAVGETVKVGENFGLKISQIGDVKQIIQALGAARS
jgi:flagellar motor switch protein FliN/FliY